MFPRRQGSAWTPSEFRKVPRSRLISDCRLSPRVCSSPAPSPLPWSASAGGASTRSSRCSRSSSLSCSLTPGSSTDLTDDGGRGRTDRGRSHRPRPASYGTRSCWACRSHRCAGSTAPDSARPAGSGSTTSSPAIRTRRSTLAGPDWPACGAAWAAPPAVPVTARPIAPTFSIGSNNRGRSEAQDVAQQHSGPPFAVEDDCGDPGGLPEPRLWSAQTAAHCLHQLRAVRRQAGSYGLTGRPITVPNLPTPPAIQALAVNGAVADPSGLVAALGVEIEPALLERALTHRSYAYEHGGLPHNERLEFLGDSRPRHRHHRDALPHPPGPGRGAAGPSCGPPWSTCGPSPMSGAPSVRRRPAASGSTSASGAGEEVTGGRDKASILADTLEAVLGAGPTCSTAWSARPR